MREWDWTEPSTRSFRAIGDWGTGNGLGHEEGEVNQASSGDSPIPFTPSRTKVANEYGALIDGARNQHLREKVSCGMFLPTPTGPLASP